MCDCNVDTDVTQDRFGTMEWCDWSKPAEIRFPLDFRNRLRNTWMDWIHIVTGRWKRLETVPITGYCPGESGAHDDDPEEESWPAQEKGSTTLERTHMPDVFQKIIIVERIFRSI